MRDGGYRRSEMPTRQGSIGLVRVALTDLSGGHQVANLFSQSTQCCIRTFQDSLQAIAVTKF
jgi:hypothetical protein